MEALGINIVNMVINLVLFLIFYSLIHKVVLKKLAIVLEQRKASIDEGMQNTQKSKDLIDSAQTQVAELMKNAKLEAETIIKEAKKLAEVEAKEVITKVESEATLIRERANSTLAVQRQKMETEFDTKVELSVKQALEKLFRENPEYKK